MNNLFYAKLAASNIKKNGRYYMPYLLTCIGCIIMFYIMFALSQNQGLRSMSGGAQLESILFLGSIVIGFFSVIFLFYTNSFLIKRRKKEFGLFHILGMEKKHLSKIMFYETLYVTIISFLVGIPGGILLSKLMHLLLLKILSFEVQMGFEISIYAILTTLLIFIFIFILNLIKNIRQIYISNPIELLKGGQLGEKEPKTKWILTILGVICLSIGYFIAVTTKEPLSAIFLFFVAVILVIIGTYCLFTAGSIALLKLLRKNKNYYYKTKHFISVSGMIYRMKQNAVGLANICILSTMVLVILSSTISLYIGSEDVLRTRYPKNMMITSYSLENDQIDKLYSDVHNVLKQHQADPVNLLSYRYTNFAAKKSGNQFLTNAETGENMSSAFRYLYFIPLEDYNRITGQNLTLEQDEIFIYSNRDAYKENTLSIYDKTFSVKDRLNSFVDDGSDTALFISSHFIIVNDYSIVEELAQLEAINSGSDRAKPNYYLGFDLEIRNEESIVIYEDIRTILQHDFPSTYIDSVVESRGSFYSVYGGIFFLGIFLGILFMMATILIIYYKQISEGYDDKERFNIMQKVGMSRDEVKKTIHSQVLTVFLLPLLTAVIHICFAFPVITKLLALFSLTNIALFSICTICTVLIFGLFYALIYTLTAKEYYKIVKW